MTEVYIRDFNIRFPHIIRLKIPLKVPKTIEGHEVTQLGRIKGPDTYTV